jgi:predicted Zn finger-like uncharacterized protein
MIIECPACTTRYDIKAPMPPEGRSVRCAKCGAIWRVTPEAPNGPATRARSGEPDESNSAESNARAGHGTAGGDWNERAAFDAQAGDDVDPFGDPAISGGQNELQAGSELFQRPAFPAPITNDEISGRPSQGEDEEPSDSRDAGKVRWFGFRRKNGAKPGSGGEPALDQSAAAPGAETIPFPRSNPAAAYLSQERNDLNSLDEARAAVRSVFDSLGDQRAAAHAFNVPALPQIEPERFSLGETDTGVHSRSEDEPAGNEWFNASKLAGLAAMDTHSASWEQELSEGHSFETGPEQGGLNGEDRLGEEAPGQRMRGWQADLVTEEDEDDADAQLRSALRAHFPARDQAAGGPHASALQYGQQTAHEELERSGSEQAEPAWTPRALHRDRQDSPLPETEDAFNEISEGDHSFDPRLFRELEETRELARHPRRANGTGGLALAAAWGLFLCIAAGLTVGFAGFRDITAGTLPGLAPLYRALGMPVTDQPLIFEGVQYEWTTPENKPALNIKGAVYNRAQRGVKVPDFVITIKDADPAFDREYSAKLQVHGSKIKPEEHAEFEIELLSPNPSITAVELELRSVR